MADAHDDITERVMRIIAETQRIDPASFTANSTFEEMNVDSLDGINIVFAVEEQFGITVPDEAVKDLRSVSDVVEGVRKLLAGESLAPVAAAAEE